MNVLKRAHTESEKLLREERILAAASELMLEKGYFDLSMTDVAERAGLAKGTLYLYFKTKEELFLTLFEQRMLGWFDWLEAQLESAGDRVSPGDLRRLLVGSIVSDPQLCRLVALSAIIFERNISYERARRDKLAIYGRIGQAGALIDRRLGWRSEAGAQLLTRLYVIVAGLEGLAHPAPVSRRVYENEPGLPQFDFAAELEALVRAVMGPE